MKQGYWYIIVAALFYGTITFGGAYFVQTGLSAYEIALYSMLLMTLLLLPVIVWRKDLRIKKKMLGFFAIFGLFNALQEFTQFGALSLGVPVAIVALLLYSQPIWTTILAYLILNERITAIKLVAVFLSIIGVIILVLPFNTGFVGSMAGLVCAILGGIFLSLWVIWARKSGIEKQHYVTTTFGCVGFSFLWLLVFWPVIYLVLKDTALTRISIGILIQYLIPLLFFVMLSGIIPHLLFYRGIRKVPASIGGIILLLEPVSASILAYVFFSQTLVFHMLIGGFFIILANIIILSRDETSIKLDKKKIC